MSNQQTIAHQETHQVIALLLKQEADCFQVLLIMLFSCLGNTSRKESAFKEQVIATQETEKEIALLFGKHKILKQNQCLL